MQDPAPTRLDEVAAAQAPAAPNRLPDGDRVWTAFSELAPAGPLPALLETIAAAAGRLAGADHARALLLPSCQGVCNGAGGGACCAVASLEGEWTVPLVHGGVSLGELRFRGGADGESLRRFAALASLRLQNERLAERLAAHGRKESHDRAREERLAAVLSHAPIALSVQDADLRYAWVEGTTLLPPEVMAGRTDADLFPPDESAAIVAIKRHVLVTGMAAQAEITTSLGGSPRSLHLWVAPLRDSSGRVCGISCASVDVTARVREAGQRERLLHQREDERAWLHSVIERSPVGILLVELEKGAERTTANQRAAELLGHPVDPERARPMVSGRLLRTDGTTMSFDELPSSRALRGERVSMEEAMLRRLDGSVLPIVVSAGPIVDAAGRHAGAVVTFDDITPFKELERLREQWTSLITHDLRQPITSIGGFAGVLAEHPDLPDHLRSKVVHIVAAAKRLGRMTADLLEASRLESNQLALERQPTDLGTLVRAVVERLGAELQDHPVAVELLAPLPVVQIDPERFEQVLGNLLSNAAKYSPPGTPIAVELDLHGGEVVIGVTNEGQGLPAEELGNLFRRYHRTDEARRSRVRGLGLGLYIARGLVEAHRGRIWAESDPGRTVTFRFALPIER